MTVAPSLDIAEIATLEEPRQARAVAAYADLSQPIAGGMMCFGGPQSHANQAVGLGMNAPVTDADFDHLIAFYESRGHEPRVDVCPFSHDSLIQGLSARKFVVKEFETVLARDMRLEIPTTPPQIVMKKVDPADDQQIRQLIKIVVEGFAIPVADSFERMVRRALTYPNTFAFIASIDDHPAGAGSCDVTP